MRILHKSLVLTALILGVSLVFGLAEFWRPTIRGIGFCQTIQWLIDEGHSSDEIAKNPEIARLTRGELRIPTNVLPPDDNDLTKSDRQFALAVLAVVDQGLEEFKVWYAESVADSIEWELRSAPVVKKLAVQEVIIAALETHAEGEEPFTVENSLPASVRATVEEAFGDDTDALLLEIEKAFSTYDARTRVLESHGGSDSIEWKLRSASEVKKMAVEEVIIAALETHAEGEEPFTIENSLPASVRATVEEAFGDDTDALLLEIEKAFSTNHTYTRVLESHGGIEGFLNYLVDFRFAPSAE